MTAGHFVMSTAEHPAYPLRKVPGHAHGEQSAGFEYPFNLLQHAVVVDNVFEYLGADNLIKSYYLQGRWSPDARTKSQRLDALKSKSSSRCLAVIRSSWLRSKPTTRISACKRALILCRPSPQPKSRTESPGRKFRRSKSMVSRLKYYLRLGECRGNNR